MFLPTAQRSAIYCFIAEVHGQTICFSDVPFLNEQVKSVATANSYSFIIKAFILKSELCCCCFLYIQEKVFVHFVSFIKPFLVYLN